MKRSISILLSVIILSSFLTVVSHANDEPAEGDYIYDYVLVVIKKEYSIPGKVYTPEFFDAELVESVEDRMPVDLTQEDLSGYDLEKWQQLLKLNLKIKDREHACLLIERLSKNVEVECAELDTYGLTVPVVPHIRFEGTGCYVGQNYVYLPDVMTYAELKSKTSPKETVVTDKDGIELSENNFIPTGSVISLSQGGTLIEKYTFVLPGDADCNGIVDTLDARKALRIAVGLEEPEDYCVLLACDVDCDPGCFESVEDARSILRGAVNLEDRSVWFDNRCTDFPANNILVTIKSEYRNPDGVYEPGLFNEDMVRSVDVVLDRNNTVILRLNLVQPGKENAELLLRHLRDNPMIQSASKNAY